ncbi:hypothetical protein BB561_002770 [Smittium simulii]|uniref:Rrp15p-domain-containing protein n=1 Tax=Smittium simulii TaxID=133385 RepID=A0A2T9YP97_9FUNG|nr:hypothetical protein BB561_002770 [Smittium simulii]
MNFLENKKKRKTANAANVSQKTAKEEKNDKTEQKQTVNAVEKISELEDLQEETTIEENKTTDIYSNEEQDSDVDSFVGSGSELENSDDDSNSDSESFLKGNKKPLKKRNRTVTIDEFMGGISSILNQDPGLDSTQGPILSKNKQAEIAIEEQKKLALERREKTRERQLALQKNHIVPDNSTISYEKDLKKIATRGVVQLFNAIKTSQASVVLAKGGKKSEESLKKQEDLANMTKNSFLDLLKTSY